MFGCVMPVFLPMVFDTLAKGEAMTTTDDIGPSESFPLFTWASALGTAMVVLLGACSSSNGASTTTVGGSAGQTQVGDGGMFGQGGQTTTVAAGGSTGGSSGHGGQTTTVAAGGSTGGRAGQGGQTTTMAAGGSLGGTSSQGGQTTTMAAGGSPGGATAQGGQTTAQGGSPGGTNGQGGQSTTLAQGGSSGSSSGEGGAGLQPGTTGGGGAGGTSDPIDTSVGGAGGSSGVDGGGGSGGDSVVGNPRRVLLCDEGNLRVALVDLEDPGTGIWTTPVDSLRDMQLVGGDRVAVSTAKGYVELDINTGEVKKQVSAFSGVESIRRLPNGNTVLGANAEGGVTLQELDSQDAPVAGHKVTFTNYVQFRMLRRTPQGTFLIGVGSKLAEVNWDQQTLWEMTIPDGDYVYQGLRLPDNTIAVTSGYGAAILVIDPVTKTVLTTIGGKTQPDAATIVPNFYAGYQILKNGHFVVTNWEGHGGGHGATGAQLLEYDPSGQLVWTWKQDPTLVSSLHHVIVLDGLDTTKLHDDVDGVLAPVTQ
jgi:hypothetical protein